MESWFGSSWWWWCFFKCFTIMDARAWFMWCGFSIRCLTRASLIWLFSNCPTCLIFSWRFWICSLAFFICLLLWCCLFYWGWWPCRLIWCLVFSHVFFFNAHSFNWKDDGVLVLSVMKKEINSRMKIQMTMTRWMIWRMSSFKVWLSDMLRWACLK